MVISIQHSSLPQSTVARPSLRPQAVSIHNFKHFLNKTVSENFLKLLEKSN